MLDLLRKIILKITYPILKLGSKIHIPKRKITGKFYHKVLSSIKPGDIIVTRSRFNIPNLYVPGYYTHAALYMGIVDGAPTIIEAAVEGVRLLELSEFLFCKDYAKVLRVNGVEDYEIDKLLMSVSLQIGKPYDWGINSNVEAFYCSELIQWGYEQIREDASVFDLRVRMGAYTITPDDFDKATSKCTLIANSEDFNVKK